MQISAEAKKYQKIKSRLLALNLILSLSLLILAVISGFSLWLKSGLSRFLHQPILLNGLYVLSISLLFYLIEFPLEFYDNFILERRFKLSNQSASDYLKDNLKKALISLFITLIAVEFLYLFLGKFPNIWWFISGVGWFLVTIILTKITPTVFVPLFYKYIPLEDKELGDKIKNMFRDANVPLKDVYMINFSSKTNKLNAAVVGFGKGRRVLLTDNLLKELSYDQILCIVAHELGHYKNKDTLKIITFSCLVTLVLFFLSDIILKRSFLLFGYNSISDIAGFPLFGLIMFVLGFSTLPVQNGFIRSLERKADIYSIKLSRNPLIFISMMEKLAQKNLSEVSPSWLKEIFFYDHPPISKRIQLARKMMKTDNEIGEF